MDLSLPNSGTEQLVTLRRRFQHHSLLVFPGLVQGIAQHLGIQRLHIAGSGDRGLVWRSQYQTGARSDSRAGQLQPVLDKILIGLGQKCLPDVTVDCLGERRLIQHSPRVLDIFNAHKNPCKSKGFCGVVLSLTEYY